MFYHLRYDQKGFSLIEVLVAMSLLSIGLLAVAMTTVQGLKSKVDSEVHSRAMQIASFYTEPLKQAIAVDTDTFVNQLQALEQGSSIDSFAVDLKSSRDASGNDIRQTPTELLTPPYTLVLDITYQKGEDVSLQFASTHVFVPAP